MAHNGDSDEEQAGPSGSEEPVTFTQAGAGFQQQQAFQMGGLGSALPSSPGGHPQHMHRAQQPHQQYPHAIQYALPPSQPEPQYHARAFEPYGHGPPPRPFHADTFDPASYGRLQQQLQQQQQQQQAGGFAQQRQQQQYPFGYAGGPQQAMPQQHWGVASQAQVMPSQMATHWTAPNGMQMRMPQQVALPLPPLPGQPMVPPMPPQMSVQQMPPLPPQSSWPGGPGLEAAAGYGLAQPAGGPQQWQGQGGPHSPHRGGGQGGWDPRQGGQQMMPQVPNELPLPRPGTSWQGAQQLSLAEIGRWERPTSPLQAPPPSTADIGRSEIGRWERPTSPLPPRPGYGSRGRPSVVLTNFTDLAVGELEVYKHDVTFSPEMKTSQVRRRILTELAPQIQQLLPEVPSGWAYDGDKILYSVGRLGSGPIELMRSEEGAEGGGGGSGGSGGSGDGSGGGGGGGAGAGAGAGAGGAGRKKREVVVTLKEVGQLNLGGLRLPTGKTYEGATERLRPMMQVLHCLGLQPHLFTGLPALADEARGSASGTDDGLQPAAPAVAVCSTCVLLVLDIVLTRTYP